MLQGLYRVTMTADWRVLVPRPWRCAFNTATRPAAFVTRRDAGCWRVYPSDDFGALFMGYEPLSEARPADHADLRMIGSARPVLVDWRGRIGVPAELRDWVAVAAPFPAVLVGMGKHVELWPQNLWNAGVARDLGLDEPTARQVLALSAPYLEALR